MGLGFGGGRRDWSAHFMAVVYFIFGDSAFLVGPPYLQIARVALPRYCNMQVFCKSSMFTLGSQCCSVASWRELVVAPFI